MTANSSILNRNFDYDAQNDVLYVTISPGIPCYGDEESPGVIVLRAISDDSLTGVTILNFKKKYTRNAKELKNTPIPIDFAEIYYSL